jgi:hypothetical protein
VFTAMLLAAVVTYLGQPAPGPAPQLFAPGWINTGVLTRDLTLAPDGLEAFFTVMLGDFTQSAVATVREVDGVWTTPELAPFSRDARWRDLEPHLAPDGRHLYFASDRTGNEDLWVCLREDRGWGEPVNLGPRINTPAPEFFPSVTRGGTLYFTRTDTTTGASAIWRARPAPGGGHLAPERLPDVVNAAGTQFNAFIAPDESYLIVCAQGRPDNRGAIDYWLARRDQDDTWHAPVNMGPLVNGAGREGWSASVSPDGKVLFFMSRKTVHDPAAPRTWASLQASHASPGNGYGHLWWVDAESLATLRE